MSNAQDFGYIDAKLLPNVLEVVQKYSQSMNEDNYYVRGYSIVYEVMQTKFTSALITYGHLSTALDSSAEIAKSALALVTYGHLSTAPDISADSETSI
eukprot:scaffold14323_cov72-Skeletonema_dohrnii-CCMP3373.AAC.1